MTVPATPAPEVKPAAVGTTWWVFTSPDKETHRIVAPPYTPQPVELEWCARHGYAITALYAYPFDARAQAIEAAANGLLEAISSYRVSRPIGNAQRTLRAALDMPKGAEQAAQKAGK